MFLTIYFHSTLEENHSKHTEYPILIVFSESKHDVIRPCLAGAIVTAKSNGTNKEIYTRIL